MKPTPLLIFSDAPSASSGLGRICRELATRISAKLPELYQVATVGYGGSGSSRFGFHQYHWEFKGDWIIRELPELWEDFTEGRKGILLTIHDASRMLWLARPEVDCTEPRLRDWLRSKPFRKWGYFPIDASGVNERFTYSLQQTYLGYDRILAYTEFGRTLIENTIGKEESATRGLAFIPHGIDTKVFYPRDKQRARARFAENLGVANLKFRVGDELLVGIVATNQARKDFGLGVATVAELAKLRPVKLWIQTDVLERQWSIPSLLYDFGLLEKAFVTTANYPDEVMAEAYSACDVTLGIGNGEGFGYPIFESLACNTPCVHGDYGGAAEFMHESMLVKPVASRLESPYDSVRMVYNAPDWALAANRVVGQRTRLPEELDWDYLWARWNSWLT